MSITSFASLIYLLDFTEPTVFYVCNYRLNREEVDRFAQFETKFKKFMYGGVTVQHLKPNSALTRDGLTRREKRTLWLMLPEVGSLRLGLVSRVKDNSVDTSMDDVTVASSAASSRADADVSICSRWWSKVMNLISYLTNYFNARL